MRLIRFKEKKIPEPNLISGWKLFGLMFKKGEEVVIIDDVDRLHWGQIRGYGEKGITLGKGRGRPTKILGWDDVQFIAHDGFPVRPLVGADGSGSIEFEDTGMVTNAVRRDLAVKIVKGVTALDAIPCPGCRLYFPKDDHMECRDKEQNHKTVEVCIDCYTDKDRYYVIRHPYLIESVPFNALVNKGIEEEILFKTKNGVDDYVETIVMKSKDGAGALLWDIPHIYYFE